MLVCVYTSERYGESTRGVYEVNQCGGKGDKLYTTHVTVTAISRGFCMSVSSIYRDMSDAKAVGCLMSNESSPTQKQTQSLL